MTVEQVADYLQISKKIRLQAREGEETASSHGLEQIAFHQGGR